MRWAVAFVVTTACGRFEFDARLDATAADAKPCLAPVGHDEDGDGIDDACDGCPHIPDAPQLDSDGDGVDDGCDPNPTSPRETIAFFDAFVTQRPEWRLNSMLPVIANDSMTIPLTTQIWSAAIDVLPGTDTFSTGGHLGASTGTFRQFTVSANGPGPAHYYCELYGDLNSGKLGATYTFDDMTYFNPATSPAQVLPIENADVSLTLLHAPPDFSCITSYPVDMPRIEAPIPAITASGVYLSGHDVAVRLDYFILIHTQ